MVVLLGGLDGGYLPLWCEQVLGFQFPAILGPPVVPFYPFFGEGSPTKGDYSKKGYPYSNFSIQTTKGFPELGPLDQKSQTKGAGQCQALEVARQVGPFACPGCGLCLSEPSGAIGTSLDWKINFSQRYPLSDTMSMRGGVCYFFVWGGGASFCCWLVFKAQRTPATLRPPFGSWHSPFYPPNGFFPCHACCDFGCIAFSGDPPPKMASAFLFSTRAMTGVNDRSAHSGPPK